MANFRIGSYSDALYDIAVETKSTDLYYETSKILLELIKQNPKLISYLLDISVPIEQKKDLVNQLVQDDLYRKFLYVVIEGRRSIYLTQMLEKYINRINKERNISSGIIFTTDSLDEKAVKTLEDAMSKKIDKKVSLINTLDKEIIGGIKVQIDDEVWDYTVSSQLKGLAQQLVKEVDNG